MYLVMQLLKNETAVSPGSPDGRPERANVPLPCSGAVRSHVRDMRQCADFEFVRIRSANDQIRFQQCGHFGLADFERRAVGHLYDKRLERLLTEQLDQCLLHALILHRREPRRQPSAGYFVTRSAAASFFLANVAVLLSGSSRNFGSNRRANDGPSVERPGVKLLAPTSIAYNFVPHVEFESSWSSR